jgi:hypothetical protein
MPRESSCQLARGPTLFLLPHRAQFGAGTACSGTSPCENRSQAASRATRVDSQRTLTGVAVEKLHFLQNSRNLGDRKCLERPRKSFVGHPGAILFLRISQEGVFQQPQAISLIDLSMSETAILGQPSARRSAPLQIRPRLYQCRLNCLHSTVRGGNYFAERINVCTAVGEHQDTGARMEQLKGKIGHMLTRFSWIIDSRRMSNGLHWTIQFPSARPGVNLHERRTVSDSYRNIVREPVTSIRSSTECIVSVTKTKPHAGSD